MIRPGVFRALLADVQACWPDEACGFVLATPTGQDLLVGENIQGRLHRQDPARFPADARQGFVIAPASMVRLLDAVGRGAQVQAIYHSHPHRRVAELSDDDRTASLVDGAPQFPGAWQVVVATTGPGRQPWVAQAYAWRDGDWRRVASATGIGQYLSDPGALIGTPKTLT